MEPLASALLAQQQQRQRQQQQQQRQQQQWQQQRQQQRQQQQQRSAEISAPATGAPTVPRRQAPAPATPSVRPPLSLNCASSNTSVSSYFVSSAPHGRRCRLRRLRRPRALSQ
jgi:transcription initiation factor TFIID subunit TAF12